MATVVVCLNCEFKRRATFEENYDDLSEPISAARLIDEEFILREIKKWTPDDEAEAIRNKARVMGWRLWASGGTRLMLKVFHLVYDKIAKDSEADHYGMNRCLDQWFAGIGQPTNDEWLT